MAYVANHGAVLNIRRGQRDFQSLRVYDSPFMGKTNGIYADLSTSTDVEGLISTLSPNIDGVVTSYSGVMGRYYDDSPVIPSDTVGDAKGRTYVVTFSDSTDKATIYVPNVLLTKVEDVGLALKSLTWKDSSGTTLTVQGVEVKTVL
jgi:hypothetical protein